MGKEAFHERQKILREPVMEHMQPDQYGLHTICSLYFDTEDYLLVRRSLEKPKYKEKLRLRSYGLPKQDDIVFLELKKKLDGVTYKRRVPMTLYEAEQYFKCGTQPKQTGQILEEIEWFTEWYRPMPKVLLCYDRIALYGIIDCDLRITLSLKQPNARLISLRLFTIVTQSVINRGWHIQRN